MHVPPHFAESSTEVLHSLIEKTRLVVLLQTARTDLTPTTFLSN